LVGDIIAAFELEGAQIGHQLGHALQAIVGHAGRSPARHVSTDGHKERKGRGDHHVAHTYLEFHERLSEVSAGHGDEKQVLSHASFTCEHSYGKRKTEPPHDTTHTMHTRRTHDTHDTRRTTRHDTRGERVANLEIEVKQAGKALGDVRERLAADGGAADVQQTQAVLRLRLADAQPLDLATTAAHSCVRE
jgi:hypothetical protein